MLSVYLFSLYSLCLSFEIIALDYDIVYVRYPATNPTSPYVTIPQGEKPYDIAAGADLLLLKSDGSEEVLVDCDKCSVMDPFISYDAQWVYYSLIEEAKNKSASWLYKINLNNKPFKAIRLTFDDGFDSSLYKNNITEKSNQSYYRKIRDMAPVPLADGRLLFTSNRSSLTALNSGTNAVIKGSVQQLYIMDDHLGDATTGALSNIQVLEAGNIHLVQHPFQLKDGRILFSSWQDVGHKFRYAMTSLFTINPDGSNLKQFTEPHDHHKMLEHFVTQLSTKDVITALYYPSFDYGYGILMRYPLNDSGPDFLRGSISQRFNHGNKLSVSYREFDRKNGLSITPHTTPNDVPAPNLSGKYSMPSAAPSDGLLVAYSSGSVNHFNAKCGKKKMCQALKSGIYLIPNASLNIIEHPSQLIKIKDDPNYNEIWPRAVVPYKEIYGQNKPNQIPPVDNTSSEAVAIVGTSSMYNRESNGSDDVFQSSSAREKHDGNWTIQGADAGVYSNDDIYGVRIVGTPAKPFTKPIGKYKNRKRWDIIKPYLQDARLDDVVARYGSFHGEKWEILGEFPLMHKINGLKDKQGNPDTSWQAKIPADTPFLIQMLDKNGMTLTSELTWRALKPGEERVDCGGCHAHSIPALDFKTTASGKGIYLYDVPGVDDLDPRIDNSIWDLTSGSIPVLFDKGVKFHPKGVLDVEFRRDVFPILKNKCVNCHTTSNSPNLSGNPDKVYQEITYNKRSDGKRFVTPQISKYIRSPQARQSQLVWVAWNERLDGRTNDTRNNDVDYPVAHPIMSLTDIEKRTISRWVDMGGPIDFPQTDGFGYTDDSQLPIIHLSSPFFGENKRDIDVIFGLHDVKTGIDEKSIKIGFAFVNTIHNKLVIQEVAIPQFILKPKKQIGRQSIYSLPLPERYLIKPGGYVITVEVKDNVGNKNIITRRFTLN